MPREVKPSALSIKLTGFLALLLSVKASVCLAKDLRRNPIEDGAISGFSGQKSVPEKFLIFYSHFYIFLKLNT